ncbi:MAG: zf-TFIIB domain-containing protein [Chloroflexota bacterium]
MICPKCKNDMIVVEHEEIELDYCPNCRGVWFDAGELELLLESMNMERPHQFVSDMLDSAEHGTPEKPRKCPICSQQMKKTMVGEGPKILIDICRRGDGLWFDGGEVSQLARQIPEPPPGPHSHGQISDFLAEVFKEQGPNG